MIAVRLERGLKTRFWPWLQPGPPEEADSLSDRRDKTKGGAELPLPALRRQAPRWASTEVIKTVGTEVFVDYMMQIESFAPNGDKARLIAKLLVAVKADNVQQSMPQLWNPKIHIKWGFEPQIAHSGK